MVPELFRFLDTEEFNALPQAEKLAYLGRAVAVLNEQRGGGWSQLFADPLDRPWRKMDA
jgi:hypothetical protein